MQEIKKLIRNSTSNLIEGLEYPRDEFGLIEWRKLIPYKFLFPNKQRTQETDVTKLEDKDLLISLAGIKYLLRLYGYYYIKYPVVQSSPHHCSVVCEIQFLENIETNNKPLIASGLGDATQENVSSGGGGFAKYFLGPIAENRALVRCVKNFLGINILGADEIGETTILCSEAISQPNSPALILQQLMTKHHYSFEDIKKKLVQESFPNAEALQKVEDIPVSKILNYIERIKKKG